MEGKAFMSLIFFECKPMKAKEKEFTQILTVHHLFRPGEPPFVQIQKQIEKQPACMVKKGKKKRQSSGNVFLDVLLVGGIGQTCRFTANKPWPSPLHSFLEGGAPCWPQTLTIPSRKALMKH